MRGARATPQGEGLGGDRAAPCGGGAGELGDLRERPRAVREPTEAVEGYEGGRSLEGDALDSLPFKAEAGA